MRIAAAQDAAVAQMIERIDAARAQAAEDQAIEIVMIQYRRDEDMPLDGDFEPSLIPTASAQRMVLARVKAARPLNVALLPFAPTHYRSWLGLRADTRQARAEWAAVAIDAEPGTRLGVSIGPKDIGWALMSGLRRRTDDAPIDGGESPLDVERH
ncbi:hypothetical protein [Methylosinus sp. Sm6]|uniref:hypothetical protein n=1 Tax=Methylosinus sp. Sm6 TaxID=2866948 RepID=UPI001C99E579|nr:hypothetical protein [Methylosinus sp. Sm6]MBY6243241.1 hypothetical protein [Methylosinus sp. Sm6]